MTNIPSKIRLRNFRNRIRGVLERELECRSDIKRLYRQFLLDVGESKVALRHVRQAFYQIQKDRMAALLKEQLEFHPFFSITTEDDLLEESEDEDDDGII